MIPDEYDPSLDKIIEIALELHATAEVALSTELYWYPNIEECEECRIPHLWWYMTPEGQEFFDE